MTHKFNYFINERRLKKIKTIKMGKDEWLLAIKSIEKSIEYSPFRLFSKAIKTIKTVKRILKVDLETHLVIE